MKSCILIGVLMMALVAPAQAEVIADAPASPDRLESDRERDERSRPRPRPQTR